MQKPVRLLELLDLVRRHARPDEPCTPGPPDPTAMSLFNDLPFSSERLGRIRA
jgi:hypothetical protein